MSSRLFDKEVWETFEEEIKHQVYEILLELKQGEYEFSAHRVGELENEFSFAYEKIVEMVLETVSDYD